ncbi:MAG: methyltransferase [Lewinellaceae bacterium]|nr:methyltransferase [Lewinellaceae bacterium]
MILRFMLRHTWLPIYRFWALRHIRRTRTFRYAGLRIEIPQGVFHPGVFFSTPIFLNFLENIDFQGKKVLDIGAGSGVLALFAAKKGAQVTAVDINPLAVDATRRNARENNLDIQAIESDLFDHVPPQRFDLVLINPPYYPQQPRNSAEKAFFAGEDLEYFDQLFRQLGGFTHRESTTLMILSEDCDLAQIKTIAMRYGYGLPVIFERKKWGERFLILTVQPTVK